MELQELLDSVKGVKEIKLIDYTQRYKETTTLRKLKNYLENFEYYKRYEVMCFYVNFNTKTLNIALVENLEEYYKLPKRAVKIKFTK